MGCGVTGKGAIQVLIRCLPNLLSVVNPSVSAIVVVVCTILTGFFYILIQRYAPDPRGQQEGLLGKSPVDIPPYVITMMKMIIRGLVIIGVVALLLFSIQLFFKNEPPIPKQNESIVELPDDDVDPTERPVFLLRQLMDWFSEGDKRSILKTMNDPLRLPDGTQLNKQVLQRRLTEFYRHCPTVKLSWVTGPKITYESSGETLQATGLVSFGYGTNDGNVITGESNLTIKSLLVNGKWKVSAIADVDNKKLLTPLTE